MYIANVRDALLQPRPHPQALFVGAIPTLYPPLSATTGAKRLQENVLSVIYHVWVRAVAPAGLTRDLVALQSLK